MVFSEPCIFEFILPNYHLSLCSTDEQNVKIYQQINLGYKKCYIQKLDVQGALVHMLFRKDIWTSAVFIKNIYPSYQEV